MRVLVVTHYYPAHGGGVEKVAEQIARRVAGDAADLTWCASDTDGPPYLPGVRCVPMRTINGIERLTGFPYPLWTTGALRRLAQEVARAEAVHIHDGIYFGSLVATALARRYDKRLVVTQHIAEVPLRRPLNWILAAANRLAAHFVLARADAVAFVSPAVRSHFESLVGPRPTFHYVPNGVDTETFHPTAVAPEALRAQLGFDPHRPLMLFVGRFVPKKRLHIVREIAAQHPDWQWCVIGQGPEDPVSWGLPNVAVRAPMPQAELADFYRAADLLVLPSEGEGFPLVVQEAMACGLPACVSTAVAAGSTIPRDLILTFRDDPASPASSCLNVVGQWLLLSVGEKRIVRVACASYATRAWHWSESAGRHAGWLRTGGD